MEKLKSNNILTPIAIVIAGALIAAALYFGGNGPAEVADSVGQVPKVAQQGSLDKLAPISKDDHVRGNANAPVTIIEYSDFECPFCKRFHTTMQDVMSEYGENGKVAWVYRHFPLDRLHSKAREEAMASECANELGGREAFWKFTDRFFELTPSNNRTDTATILPQIVREIGISESVFNTCLQSRKYETRVQKDADNATATGGSGTPWSILVTKSGKKYPISGAQSYESVKQLIDLALKE